MNQAWHKLDIKVPYLEILAEADSVKHLCVEHRDSDYSHGLKNKGWHSLTLYGVNSTTTQASNLPHNWTDVADLCPTTVKFLKEHFYINSDTGRIRFMWLEPGGMVAPHKDKEHRGYGAINIAITQPANCSFIFKDIGSIPFKPGEAYQVDTSYEHMVINKSDQTRLHMIVHSTPRQ